MADTSSHIMEITNVRIGRLIKPPGYDEKDSPYKNEYTVSLRSNEGIKNVIFIDYPRHQDETEKRLNVPTQKAIINTLQLCLQEVTVRANSTVQPVYAYLASVPVERFPKIVKLEDEQVFRPAQPREILDFITTNLARLTR